jgi:outer membrane protein assembly factor BamB
MEEKIGKATLMIAVLLMGMALMANLSILNASKPTFIGADGSVAQSGTDWWPMFRHDLQHTGYTTSEAPTTNNTVWIYQTGDVIYSSPSVVNGVVFVGSFDYNLYALNAYTGALIWNYTTGDRVTSSPAVWNGVVFIGSRDGNLYALNASTGTKIWNYTTGGGSSSPSVADGIVYAGSRDYNIYALNATTGALIWKYTTGNVVPSSPAVVDGTIFVGSFDNNTYALNATTGALIWKYTTGDWVYSSPAVANGMVFFASVDGHIYALNTTSGTQIWNYTTGAREMSSAAVADGVVFIGSGDYNVYALNATTGALIWNYTTGGYIGASPAVANGIVFVGSDVPEGKVYALNATIGTLIWSYQTIVGPDWGVISSPAVADGMVFVGSGDGKVYAFGSPSFPQSANIAVVPDTSGGVSTSTLPTSGFSDGYSPNFTSIGYSGVNYANLLQYDTVIMYQADPDQLTSLQKSDLVKWVAHGGKLIIWDSDAVPNTNYDWLPYPFTSHYPGQTGAFGGNLTILANNTLGSSDPLSPYYINTSNIAEQSDAVGDAKVFLTYDRRWFGHMWATNVYGYSGFTHAYAYYSIGIIIYSGLDADALGTDGWIPQNYWLFKIYELELKLQCPPPVTPPGPPAITYVLTITTTAGGTTNPAPGNYSYWEGAMATVTALPENGYTLDHWELDGNNLGAINPINITMNMDHALHAVFVRAQHDLVVFLEAPTFLEVSTSILVNATVHNYGLKNETNVELRLLINNTIVNYTLIPELLTNSSYTLSYTWTPTIEANYNIIAYAPPVPGEEFIINNVASKYVYVGFRVKAVVLDSWGTDFPDFTSTWDTLNTYWNQFGKKMIYIDYTGLNKENITYQDIAATGADVLIISSAYDPNSGWEFTDLEIEAIRQYVYEGHGLIITGLTFCYYVPNNNKLAPLVGLNKTIVYDFYSWTDYMNLLEPTHPLFKNIPNPYPAYKYTSIPSDGNWSSNELAGGTYLAVGTYLESAIVVYNGLVYISPMVEYYPTNYDLQLLYNAITWSKYGLHDIAITNVTTSKTVVGQDYSLNINVTVTNKGEFTETFNVTLYVNTTAIEIKQVTLTNGASTTITYTWNTTGFAKGNYTIWAYAWPVQGETYTDDNTLTDGIVRVCIPGDLNADGTVDSSDLGILGIAWGATQGQHNYIPEADINNDTIIDSADLGIMGAHWGETE